MYIEFSNYYIVDGWASILHDTLYTLLNEEYTEKSTWRYTKVDLNILSGKSLWIILLKIYS